MKRPILHLACAVLCGAVAGRTVGPTAVQALTAVLACMAAVAVLLWRAHRAEADALRAHVSRAVVVLFGLVAVFQQSLEADRERLADAQVTALAGRAKVDLRGVVAAEPVLRPVERPGAGDTVVLVLREAEAAGRPLACRVQAIVGGRAAAGLRRADLPYPGDTVRLTSVRLHAPAQAIGHDLFDYRAFLRTRRIGAVTSASNPDQLHFGGPAAGEWGARAERPIAAWRRGAIERIDAALVPERAGLLRAMLLGDTSGLGQPVRQRFARIGVAHLFSVSGVHTSLLALLAFCACRALLATPRVAAWVTLGLLAVFLVMVGFLPPVVRSAVLTFCVVLPHLGLPGIGSRRVDSLSALALGALATTLADPQAPFRSDFQLSYLCIFGLMVLHAPVAGMLQLDLEARPPRGAFARRLGLFHNLWIANGLAATVATTAMVAPFLAAYFGQVSLAAFVANLLLVPLSGLVLSLGWAFGLMGWLAPGSDALLTGPLDGLTWLFLALARLFAAPGFASVGEPAFPWWLALAYYMVLLWGRHLLDARWPGGDLVRRAQVLNRLAVALALLVL